ncbi:MAG: flavodoxin family protein [Deltaproteobacteria bacterium]|nr:flavodoxin family protein [Deltaproteobacteria bacterium]
MKKILGIIGSPRRLGNCEIMVKEISRNIPESHELQILRLPEFNFLPCKACYSCLFEKQRCVQEDDFQVVLDAIVQADALIVATPTYLFGANSSLKRFLDRGLTFYAHLENLWGTPAVGVGIAGMAGFEGYTKLNVDSFMKLTFSDVKGSEIIYGALPGEIFLNQNAKKRASILARALFAKPTEKSGPACPLCGGDTFRFLGDRKVRCMLCSNDGTIDMSSGEPVFEIRGGEEHHLFLSKKAVAAHLESLRQMKQRFIKRRKTLKEITQPYSEEGCWLKP